MFGVVTLLCSLLIQASLAQHTHDRSDLYSLLGYPDTEPGPNAEYQGNDKYYRPTNGTARINPNPATQSQPVAQQQTYNQRQMIPQQPVATSQLQQYMQSQAVVQPPYAQQVVQTQPLGPAQPAVQTQSIFQPQPVFRTQPLTQAQPVSQRQPIVQTQPAMPMQPISQPRPLFNPQPVAQTQPLFNPQPVTQTRPIFNPQPVAQPRYFQVVAQPPMTMQTQPLMQHQYMQPVVPTQQYLQSQQTRFLYPQQFMQRQPSLPAYNDMPAAATPFARTQNQENEKQGNGKRIGRIVPTIQSNLRRHQSPHIPSPPRANQHVIYGSRVPLYFFQHPGNIG